MSRAQPTVVLFDIDGTLITSGGTGRKALVRAFERLYSRGDACEHFSFAGMTDRAIFREGLKTIGAAGTEDEIDTLLEDYLSHLAHEVARAEVYAVHPGVIDALEALCDLPHVALGLGTGNVERGARTKIERVDLNHYFDFGGFGCDAEPRAELIAAGARRGAERLGLPLAKCRLVIVGDTPKDISAAHDNRGLCIAVATGGASYETLVEAGGDLVCHDLTDPRVLEALMWDGIDSGLDPLALGGGDR